MYSYIWDSLDIIIYHVKKRKRDVGFLKLKTNQIKLLLILFNKNMHWMFVF